MVFENEYKMKYQLTKVSKLLKEFKIRIMAEGVGFEPTNELPHC